ncbi:hypothetical protein [Gordonia malaquae]|uniref:hypothetical protein n=1 Tax=Gordonia malaquae TaxID=410332 RepID=UPI003018A871
MIEIVTGVDDSGEEDVDQFDGPEVTFMTEPSGALVIMKTPKTVWAAYAPGHWQRVRCTE